MARKKMRKFAGGGELEATDEIVVKGKRAPVVDEMTGFDLARFGGMGGIGNAAGAGMDGMGGGSNQRLTNLGAAPMPAKDRMAVVPAVLRQRASTLGNLMGDKGAKAYGASFRMGYAKGGKAGDEPTGGKKRTKAKKYAKGGSVSSASKRADGCATKGKTKGRFV